MQMSNSNIIDLHGLTVDEAILKIDRFINESIMNKIEEIRIIHGKGRGVLRQSVYDYLDNCPLIEKYESDGIFNNFGTAVVKLIRI